MSQRLKTFILWVLIIVVFVAFYQVFQPSPEGGGSRTESHSSWAWPLTVFVPILLIIGLFVFFLRRAGGMNNILSMRKTTARLVNKVPDVSFADVGGASEAKRRLADLVDFLKRPSVWERAGAHLPKGVLLEGPPGTGKTLLARAFAGEAKVPFFEVSASEFVEMFVGVGSARVRDLFEQANKKGTAVIFIDELDAVGRRRGSGSVSYSHQEREQTLNQLLVNLDGFQKRSRVVVIAATNRADVLDAALLRPGRFDVLLKMALLTEQERAEVLAIHLRKKPLAFSVTAATLAARMPHTSGADLEQIVNEAAIQSIRRSGKDTNAPATILLEDFDEVLAARAARRSGFDQLDTVLIESGSQLVQPNARVAVHLVLVDRSEVSGDVLWADERFVKLKTQEGGLKVVARSSIVRLESLAGTAPAEVEDVRPDSWAHVRADSA